jgi:crotonobetainyl-CoA:carnitine CoA-transferase CaiB-like acyl-CoA transferase
MSAYINDIVGVLTAVAALIAAIVSVRNSGKIREVHISINSRMDQLLTERGIAARAEGVIEGQAQKATISVPPSD